MEAWQMNITLIQPNTFGGKPHDAMEPLAFAILRALTPPDVEVAFYDERIETIPLGEATDVAVLSISTFAAQRAYQVAAGFKARGIPVIAGGFHPTLCPDEAARFVDCVVIGDAEETWPGIVDDLKNGRLKKRYESQRRPLADILPDRSLFRHKKYVPVLPVQFGRGCRYRCDFCSIHAFYGTTLRQRPLECLAKELDGLRAGHIMFTDDNLLQDRSSFDALLSCLEGRDRNWSCQVSIDAAGSAELVERMATAGCRSVTVGFESLDPANLRQMGKSANEQCGDYGRAIRAFNDCGIMVYGCFVFGYDADTPDSFKRTLDFALGNHLFLANFIPLTPMPGTPLYARLKTEGRLINDPWWLDAGYRYGKTVFRPCGMSPEQLEEGVWFLRTEFNRYRNMAKRMARNPVHRSDLYNAAAFLATNLTARKEIKRKHCAALYALNEPIAQGCPP